MAQAIAESAEWTRYQAGFEAGLAAGREAGYRRGYQDGFTDGRTAWAAGQKTCGSEVTGTEACAPPANLQRAGTEAIATSPTAPPSGPKPTAQATAPKCSGPTVVMSQAGDAKSAAPGQPEAASVSRGLRYRLLGLPCATCGTYYYNDEPQCPHCKTPNAHYD